ncbi:MAG TPA: BamA/TamA family outer membrane protein, partial [Aquaticitalea sp.]|nr:BamA/TamA family outer membrane protein [Aquaticitalea sp.]
KNSFFIRLNGAVLNSTDFLENELFRFGGINSVGGFEENSLIANLFSAINTEYRYELNNSLYIHSVFDASYFENKIVDTKGKLFSYGFGFGLLTKAGLFKLNYSIGKIEKQSFKLSDSKIHLSLSSSF